MVLPGIIELAIVSLFTFLFVLPFWKIFSKAGYSPWLSLIVLVPLANILLLFFLAFSEWPVHREISLLKGHGDEQQS